MKRNRSFIAASIVVLVLIYGVPEKSVYAATSNAQQLYIDGYQYKSVRKSDPFKPFVERDQLLMKRAQKKAIVSIFPLQKAGVDQFKLVGIAGNANRRVAIVEAMDGKGRFYPVTIGTVIGLNRGKVVEIRRDLVVIEEAISGRSGRKINRIIKKLHEEEGTP